MALARFALVLALFVGIAQATLGARVSSGRLLAYYFNENTGTTVNDNAPTQSCKSSAGNIARGTASTWANGVSGEPAGLYISGSTSSPVLVTASPTDVYTCIKNEGVNGYGFSLDIWVRPAAISGNQTILEYASNVAVTPGGVAANVRPFSIRLQSNGRISAAIASQANAIYSCQSTTPLVANQLTHIVFVSPDLSPGTNYMLYVNDVLQICPATSETMYSWVGTSQLSAMSTRVGGTELFTGYIYSLTVYVSALTAANVATNYAAGPYNAVPVGVARTVTMLEDVDTMVFALTATDPYDTVFSYTISTLPAKGTLYQVVVGGAMGAAIAAGGAVTNSSGYVMFVTSTYEHGTPYTSFTFTASDGEVASAPATLTIAITHVNHAPNCSAPVGSFSGPFSTPLQLTGFAAFDIDGDALTVTVQSSQGLLSLASTAGLTFVAGDGTSDSAVMFSGTVANINAALATVSYSALFDTAGADTVTVIAEDGSGATSTPVSVAVSVLAGC